LGQQVSTGKREAPKLNYDEAFDRPPFIALAKVVKVNKRGKPVNDRHGRVLYEEVVREERCPGLDWLKKHMLTADSRPSAWINALLPLKKKAGDPTENVTVDDWKEYPDTRAAIKTIGSSFTRGNLSLSQRDLSVYHSIPIAGTVTVSLNPDEVQASSC
jgi:hypothetical protein